MKILIFRFNIKYVLNKNTWALRSADGLIAILIIEGFVVSFNAKLKACLIWSAVDAKYPLKPSKALANFSYLENL